FPACHIRARDGACLLSHINMLQSKMPVKHRAVEARDIPRGVNIMSTCFHVLVHYDTVVNSQPCLLGESRVQFYPHSDNNKVGWDGLTALQFHSANMPPVAPEC